MEKFTVCFVSHHFKNPSVFLDTILKMTPNRSGKWKEMTAITDPFLADVVVCVDGYAHIPIPKERAVYFNQHPFGVRSFKPLNDKPESLGVFPADKFLNLGEWWISYDYDTLKKLEPPKKTKNVLSISTYNSYPDKPTYQHRIRFLEKYSELSDDIDIYGRQEERFRNNPKFIKTYRGVAGNGVNCNYLLGEHIIGKDIEIDYRYALDFDHGRDGDGKPVKNYFSERFYDSLLLWTMPIYFGCDNVHSFLPENSFRYIDISGTDEEVKKEADKALSIIKSDFREQNLAAMKEARELLLDKYQTWAYTYNIIKSL